jgi:FxsC-like protein
MTAPGDPDRVADVDPPVFFLSYARTPVSGEGIPDPDKLVFEFYAELNRQVAQRTGTAAPADVGFVERLEDPPERLYDALARCRVFVPLCSPRYFASEICGRQWSAFARRPGTVPGAPPAIVPVLWTPVPAAAQPQAAISLPTALTALPAGVGGPDVQERYEAEGIYGLMVLEEDDLVWRSAIARLAERIAATARTAPASEVPPSAADRMDSVPDAFAVPPPSPRLGIAVLAPTRHRLPAGRAADCYGPSPLAWRPYVGTTARGPLADRMREMARNLGFTAVTRSFDEAADELLDTAEPEGPWVLVVDPWALDDPDTRALLRRFDERDRPWATVLAPLDPEDPQTAESEDRLRQRLQESMPRRFARSRVLHRTALTGIPTAEAFGRLFAELSESTSLRFLRRPQVTFPSEQSVGPSTTRPTLGIEGMDIHGTDDTGTWSAPGHDERDGRPETGHGSSEAER